MRGKIFIPMSIDQTSTTRSSYFFSPVKSLFIIGGVIPGIPWTMYAYTGSGDSFLGLGIGALTYLFLYSFLLRFIVFEEKRLKKMLKSLDENKKSNIEYFWGIDEIDKDGVIHYRYNTGGLKKAVIVKVERGSTVGVPSDFERRFKEVNLKFTRGLLSQNFSYMKYTKLEKKQLPEGLKDYSKRLQNIKDDAQRAVMKLNIDTISNFTKDYKSVVVDYYVIYNKDIRLMKSFRSVIRDTMLTAFGNEVYFRGTKILNDDEAVDFIGDVLNIKAINKKGYYNIEDYKFEDFGEVFRLFDDEGNEIFIDLEREVEEKSKSRIRESRGGKSLEQLEAELEKEMGSENEDISIEDDIEEEIIYIDDDSELENLDGDEYEIVYVDEDGNAIDNYEEEVEEDDGEEYDLEGVDLFTLEDIDDIPKKNKS